MDHDQLSFMVQPQTPQRQIRHKNSLEHVFCFTLVSPPPLPQEVAEATLLFHTILDDCRDSGAVLRKPSGDGDSEQAGPGDEGEEDLEENHDAAASGSDGAGSDDGLPAADGSVPLHLLFRAIYDYCPEPEGQVNIVRIVLHGLFTPVENLEIPDERSLRRIIPRANRWLKFNPEEKEAVYRTLTTLASDFLEGFFVPLKAQGRCTPSVSRLITPTSRSEVGADQGTPTRLHDLRRLCLARDGNRCVVTRKMDRSKLRALYKRTRRTPTPNESAINTQAAHIIPHSLNALSTSTSLHPTKCTVWRIMNMFDPGISASLAGTLIDTPSNALMLATEIHDAFGHLECYFEPAPVRDAHTYTFHTTRGAIPLDPMCAPAGPYVVFKNHERPGQLLADLPSPRLLKFHRACCMMLSMSGAAEYVESLLHDTETLMQRGVLAEDGSSNFALVLRLRGLVEEEEDEQNQAMLSDCRLEVESC